MTRLALLFDLDGTLIDSINLLLQSMEAAFAGRAHRPKVDSWTAGIGKPLRAQLAEWASDENDVEQLVQRYRDYQDQHLEALTSAYPHVLDVLAWARARGHAMALVTSKGRGMTERSLSQVGLAGMFNCEVTVESTTRHKPRPEPVLHALAALDIPANRALFVGDSTHDMEAGRAAGVLTAAAIWGPFSREQLAVAEPTYWLDTMLDLKPIVERLESGESDL